MKRTRLPRSSCRTAHGAFAFRAGVTLTEVLISLLVISVAVSSVLLLFPLSLLRSVKGRQLTQATILRYNVENQLDLHPGLANGLPSSRPGILDPLGWQLMQQLRIEKGLSKPVPPNFDASLIYEDRFGNYANNPPTNFDPRLLRTSGNTISEAAARKLVSLPDTWIDTARGVPTNYDPNLPGLTLPPEADLSDIPVNASGISRITVFDPTFRFSDVRTITNIDVPNKIVTLSSKLSPRVFDGNNNLGEARIEIREQRYTWMLTVRSSVRSADVVVFFRRSFSAEDERIHQAKFSLINPGPDGQPGVAGVDDNNDGFIDDPFELKVGVGGDFLDKFNRTIPIRWTAAEPPTLRRGGFIFDVQNALWYRIHDIPSLNESRKTAMLVLDEVIRTNGTGGAILMRGIVDVYPISF